MGYLKTETLKLDAHEFEIRELTYREFQEVHKSAGDAEFALAAVRFGVPALKDISIEDELPPRLVARLCREIIRLSQPEDDLVGNSEGAPTDASSSA